MLPSTLHSTSPAATHAGVMVYYFHFQNPKVALLSASIAGWPSSSSSDIDIASSVRAHAHCALCFINRPLDTLSRFWQVRYTSFVSGDFGWLYANSKCENTTATAILHFVLYVTDTPLPVPAGPHFKTSQCTYRACRLRL